MSRSLPPAADSYSGSIDISLHFIGTAARVRTEEQNRACVWLHNYARLMQVAADTLTADLGLTRSEIRDALTNPGCEHMDRFVASVKALRVKFETGLWTPCANRVSRAVRRAMQESYEDRTCSLLIGPERVGKSTPVLDEFLRKYMDCGILVVCPEAKDMRTFLAVIAEAMGLTVRGPQVMRREILGVLSTGILKMLCFDEFQRVWPSNLTDVFPEKVEFVRTAWDVAEIGRRARRGADNGGGLGIFGAVTPQFENDLNFAITHNRRWKPGQFEGRIRRTHTPDTLTEHEVRQIATAAANDFPEPAIETLVKVTLASPGLLGFMENVIGRARFLSRSDREPITADLVKTAAREMLRGTLTEKAAKDRAEKQKAA